jgi:hypothetical protein
MSTTLVEQTSKCEVQSMAKTIHQNPTSTDQADGTTKQGKKQAKRETKAMQAVEQARASVEKAQRKFAKVQQRLEARLARLHTLENKLSEMRSSSHVSDDNIPQHGLNGQSEQTTAEQSIITGNESGASTDSSGPQTYSISGADEAATAATSPVNAPVPTDQEVSLPPTEGREDIPPEDQATSEQEPANSLAETENPSESNASEEESSYPMPEEQEQNDTTSASEDTNTSTATENEPESSPEARHEWWQERIASAQESPQDESSQGETF